MSDISELLRKLRGKDSLREATKKTGISHNYIRVLEKGVDPRTGAPVNVTPDTLKAYSKGYHYEYETLMEVAGYLDRDMTSEYKPLDRAKTRLIEELKTIDDPEVIESLTNIAKNLVNRKGT